MIKTTVEELGDRYRKAAEIIWRMEPLTPRIMGHYWREQFGLYHRYKKSLFKPEQFWIEFPNTEDYIIFMLRFS